LTDLTSFTNIANWLQDLAEFGPSNISIVLVGNKNDLVDKRVISFDTAVNLAKIYNLDYIEVSALSGDNIKFTFEVITKNMAKVQDELELRESKKSKKSKKHNYKNNDIDYASRNPFDTETNSVKIILDKNKKSKSKCCS